MATAPMVRDTAQVRRTLPVRHWSDQPRFVMLRSLLVPGWGQFHNHAWFKALAVAGTEGWVGSRIADDGRALDALRRDVDAARAVQDPVAYAQAVNRYNGRLDDLTAREWLLGGILAYALIDAYVDANFKGFDIEFRQDPAFPSGVPTGVPSAHAERLPAGAPVTRAALRWRF